MLDEDEEEVILSEIKGINDKNIQLKNIDEDFRLLTVNINDLFKKT